jgi:Ca2+-binding EF-hand superfamily protein
MATKEEKLKAKFVELDTDGDGTLDFDELKDLLLKGNPNFKTNEIQKLYKKCDTNHDGRVSFDEFLAYIYGDMQKKGDLTDDTETDWEQCKLPFEAFCAHGHKDMEGKEFAKFCKDAHLIGKGMAKTDVDLIFAKVVPKGKRRMDFPGFQQACRHIALKRKVKNCEIQEIVMNSHGPEIHGTKQDAVRFYDDKSTFTGAACHNNAFDGVDPNAVLGRHEKQQADADKALHGGAEGPWEDIEKVFNLFAGPGGELDGKELCKMCEDCNLINKKYTKQAVDITFASVARKAKKIGFEQFKDIVRNIASKMVAHKEDTPDVAAIQQKIAASSGPVINATKAEYSKFHDDKSTFTGAHADVHGREGGHGADKHAELQAKHAAATAADENERPWDQVVETFQKFAGDDGLDGKEFLKFCKDAGLVGSKGFGMPQVDLVFASVVPKGKRKLDAEMFKQACREIAGKMSCPTHEVQGIVASCEGPVIVGTKGASKFHDDKSLYTGSHTDK